MRKEYAFDFAGSKEDFMDVLNAFPNNTSYSGDKFYYFDDFIVKINGEEIQFGVQRGGHSGGYWFVPTITEYSNRTEFSGKVEYIGPGREGGKARKAIDIVGYALLFVLLLPIVLVALLCAYVKRIIERLLKGPKPKEETTEEKLFDLMENYLHCVRK